MDSDHPLALEALWYAWVRPSGTTIPTPRPHYTPHHWHFFREVADIRTRMGQDVEMDIEDPLAPTVHFALAHNEYWLRVECSAAAGGPPSLQGAFIARFGYEWNGRKRLADLVEEYYAYANRLDEAIGHIKEIDAHELRLIGYDLAESSEEEGTQGSEEHEDEEQTGVCLRVRISVAGGVGEVRLRVAIADPLAYPKAIKIVDKGELLRELKADAWQPGESLVANLVELFSEVVAKGEVAEAYEKSAMKGGDEEEEDWGDAEWCKPSVVMGRAVSTAASEVTTTSVVEVHSVPCKTAYTGPAPVEGYLMREKGQDGKERTAVRGRRLEGVTMGLPEGYECRLVKEKGMGRLEPEGESASLVFWEHDREPSERSTLHRAIAHLSVASALAAPSAEE